MPDLNLCLHWGLIAFGHEQPVVMLGSLVFTQWIGANDILG